MSGNQMRVLLLQSFCAFGTRCGDQILKKDASFTNVVGKTDFQPLKARDGCSRNGVMKHLTQRPRVFVEGHEGVQPGKIANFLVLS